MPNGRNAIERERFTPDKTTFRTVVYERFTRNWRHVLPKQTRIPGPLIKARVGDDIFVHFKNRDTAFKRPHSMHFHGVHYPFGSDGSFIPGFSGQGGDVMPGGPSPTSCEPGRARPRVALSRPLAVDDGLARGRHVRRAVDPPAACPAPTASS